MNKELFYTKLYDLYGPVTRARNCFLYTKKGVRITDCYQENGRAILGWHGDSAFTHFKNVISRGQMGSYVCEDTIRMEKAVSKLLNSDRKVICFAHKMDALKAGLAISQGNTSFYSPWNENEQKCFDADAVIIAPPLPWTDSIYLLAVKSHFFQTPDSAEKEAHLASLSAVMSRKISLPFSLQAAITRSIYNLIAQLPLRQEKDWFIYDTVLTKYWERKGPYLFPKVSAEKYDDFVNHCLKLGIAINPSYSEKSIVPFGADKGVFTVLKNSPFKL